MSDLKTNSLDWDFYRLMDFLEPVRLEDGWYCKNCDQPVINGCTCTLGFELPDNIGSFGELLCNSCGEWTYPFCYNLPDEGCQYCGEEFPRSIHPCSQVHHGWRRVLFASECRGFPDDEPIFCPCGIDYCDCKCPGPTEDGYEYKEVGDLLYAKLTPQNPKPWSFKDLDEIDELIGG